MTQYNGVNVKLSNSHLNPKKAGRWGWGSNRLFNNCIKYKVILILY